MECSECKHINHVTQGHTSVIAYWNCNCKAGGVVSTMCYFMIEVIYTYGRSNDLYYKNKPNNIVRKRLWLKERLWRFCKKFYVTHTLAALFFIIRCDISQQESIRLCVPNKAVAASTFSFQNITQLYCNIISVFDLVFALSFRSV